MPHLPRSSTLIAGLTVASLLAITLPAAAQSTFHGDVARTGVYPDDGPVPVGALKWSFTAGGAIVGSPAVVDGTVYFGALDGHLHAVDAATGTEKWKFKSRMPIACTPTVTGGTVYITSSAGSLAALDAAYVGCHNGTLYAFNARTGALRGGGFGGFGAGVSAGLAGTLQPGSWGLLQELHQLHLKLHDGKGPLMGAPPPTAP